MVFFNYATMQMAAKIVYYGPGLCGKTTNLHYIYAKTSPQSRGEMVSLETETDRTLFFDLLPIDVGVIGGFKTRLQLYTIPGQVFYNTTRKLVLKGVDGIVFVADSQVAMQDANLDSFRNLRENISEIGLAFDDIPLVVQMNKRDLPGAADVDIILTNLDPERKYEHIEAIAATGVGVFETLKLISKLTLRTLRQRMTGEQPAVKVPAAQSRGATFRVKEQSPAEIRATLSGSTPVPNVAPPSAGFSTHSPSTSVATAPMHAMHEEDVEEIEASEEIPTSQPFADPTLAKTADVGASAMAQAPVAEAPKPVPEPEIRFSQTAAKADAPADTDVKRVKVRSSVDVMAELEALRKRATTGAAPKSKKDPSSRREVQKALALKVPSEVLPKARFMRVTVSFENSDGVLQKQEQTVDVSDAADAQTLSVNLRIDS